jgi:D-alanyl-D-alanine carboxypeptidase/D-alanyl-D-alanine-endopeptidase (penicillin-binding protein 4)
MVTDINKFSNNVMARQLLLTIDAELSKRPAQAKRAGRSIRDWAKARGFDLPDLVIENGSGLSRIERISAQSLAGMLEYGLTSPFASDFLSSLPLAATDGTLAKRFVNQLAEGNAYLKTGTLTGVKALAGYLLLPDGRRMLFVGIVNHGNAEAAQKALDSAVDWVYLTEAAKLKALTR